MCDIRHCTKKLDRYLGGTVPDSKSSPASCENQMQIEVVAPGGNSLLDGLLVVRNAGGDRDCASRLSFDQVAKGGPASICGRVLGCGVAN